MAFCGTTVKARARRFVPAGTVLLFALAVCSAPARADTVFMKDGSSYDGVVKQSGAQNVVIQVGKGQMTVEAADVAKIEKNDKKGDAVAVSILRAKQHEASLDERTGLNAQQRDAVRAAVDPLWSPDEAERSAARKKLLSMNKEMNVFKYLESYLPYSKEIVAPEIMQTLVDMDRVKAKDIVLPFTQNPSPKNRAKALELAGSYKSDEDLDTIARGLVDVDNSVRTAAAHAVAAAGGKRATPALIDGLQNPDPKVQNASRQALKELWSGGNAKADFESRDEWNAFWDSKAKEFKEPIATSSLTPLVSAEDAAAAGTHDE